MRFFFDSSAAFHRQLTTLYDTIRPTAAAMWNLRWQVKGYVEERRGASKEELHGRFVAGSGISSANLRRHCIENSWETQQNELALFALYAGISLYEGWTATLDIGTEKERLRLQFPSSGSASHKKAGAGETLSRYQADSSPTMERIYGPTLRASSHYMSNRREDLLLAYRCFKEARNCSAHAGRIVDDHAETAYTDARDRVAGLGLRGGTLSLPQLASGQPVVVSLTDVQALWAIMLTLVTTLDADLATTNAGQAALVQRWKRVHPFRTLAGDVIKRDGQVLRMNGEVGLPRPSDVRGLYDFASEKRLVI